MEFESDDFLAGLAERGGRDGARAVTVLFRRYLPRVYSLCRRYFVAREDAEEAASETFLRAVRGLTRGQFRGDARFSTWLIRIAGNTCMERLRQPRLPTLWIDALADTDSEPSRSGPGSGAEQDDVLEAIRLLPDDQNLAITLCDLEGYSVKQVAQIMRRRPEAVKSLHYRARRAVRDRIASWRSDGDE
jgi:RNA polymerase sigma-70 factor (ECF subfamily)